MNKFVYFPNLFELQRYQQAFFFLILWVGCSVSYGQDAASNVQMAILEKGKIYGYVYPRVRGEYLLKSKPDAGKLTYEGLPFVGLTLTYDMYNDLVFLASIGKRGNRYLILNSHKLTEFWIDDRHFYNLAESRDSLRMPPGYYQLVYKKDQTKIWKKWRIKRNRYASSIASADGGQKPFKFVPVHRYYLVREEGIAEINKKKELLIALGEESRVKPFLKSNRIKLKNPQSDVYSKELVKVMDFHLNP
ncbi:MAG: hypothetical protein AAF694_01625 [Bacteroidota bacterium]